MLLALNNRGTLILQGKDEPERRTSPSGCLKLDAGFEKFTQALDDREANAFTGDEPVNGLLGS